MGVGIGMPPKVQAERREIVQTLICLINVQGKISGTIKAHNGDLTKPELSEEAPGGTLALRAEGVD